MVGDRLGRGHALANLHISFLSNVIFADSSMEVAENFPEKSEVVVVVVVVVIDPVAKLPAGEKATSSSAFALVSYTPFHPILIPTLPQRFVHSRFLPHHHL